MIKPRIFPLCRRGALNLQRWLNVGLVCCTLLFSISHSCASETVLDTAAPHRLEDSLEVAIQDPSGAAFPQHLIFEEIDGPVSEGFTSQVVWVRFTLRREGRGSPREWWLSASNPLLRDIRLFESSFNGPLVGLEIKPAQEHRRRVFQIVIPDERPRTFLLRLSAKTALSTTLTVWQPEQLVRTFATEALFWGCIYGFFVITIAINLSFWVVNRTAPLGIYTAYVTVNFLAAFFTDAWPLQIWPELNGDVLVLLLGLWISLAPLTGVLFSSALLELHQRWPRIRRALVVASVVVSLAGVLLVAADHYRTAMPLVLGATMALIVAFFSLAIIEATRARRAGWFFLFAFSPFYAGVIWRYLRNMGWLEPSFFNDHSYQIGAIVHMLVMSVGLFVKFSRDQREQQEVAARLASQRRLGEEQRELMAMMSHEFRTPLTIAATAVENLLTEATLAPEAQRRLQKIVRAHERLHDLMEGYLTNERLLLSSVSPQIHSFDVDALCRGVVEELEESQGPAVVLKIPDAFHIMGDPSLIRIAVRNLLKNARRHSPEGSEVVLGVVPDRQGTSIRVIDRGRGVPPSERTAIFDRFYRGKSSEAHHGFGLGLHLVKSIAENHGGTVDVSDLLEGGCVFTLWLPLILEKTRTTLKPPFINLPGAFTKDP